MKIILRKILYLFFPSLKKGASILMYHSIDKNDAFFNVTPADFEKQIKYINQKGFTVLNYSELLHKFLNKEDISNHVCITFDDGYKSVFENALPILEKYNMKATMFIAGGLLGKPFTTSDNAILQIINKQEFYNFLKNNVFEFLPHSYTHKELTNLSKEEISEELNQSIKFFNNNTEKIMAYPRGKYSKDVVGVLKENEWLSAVTTDPGILMLDINPLLVPRNFVGKYTTFSEFKTLVSDSVHYYAKMRLWFIDLLKKF